MFVIILSCARRADFFYADKGVYSHVTRMDYSNLTYKNSIQITIVAQLNEAYYTMYKYWNKVLDVCLYGILILCMSNII